MQFNLNCREAAISHAPVGVLCEVNASETNVKALIVELLGKLPEQEAAELIRTEFPDWLEA